MKSNKLMVVMLLLAAAVPSHAGLTRCANILTIDYKNDTDAAVIGSSYGGGGGIFIEANNQTIGARTLLQVPAIVVTDATNRGSRQVLGGFATSLTTTNVQNVAQCDTFVGEMDQCPAFSRLLVTVTRVHGAKSQLECEISAK